MGRSALTGTPPRLPRTELAPASCCIHPAGGARGVHPDQGAGHRGSAAEGGQGPAGRGTAHGGRASGEHRAVRPDRVPGLRHPAPTQGQPAHRGCARCSACCIWIAPAGGSVPAHCGRPARSAHWLLSCGSGPPRSGLLRRCAVACTWRRTVVACSARLSGMISLSMSADSPGGRTRRRTTGVHHRLPLRMGGTAPPGSAIGRRPGRRLRPLLHATDPPSRLVRGDRRQGRARRRTVIVLRVRADLRQQTQTAPVRSARRTGMQPHLPDHQPGQYVQTPRTGWWCRAGGSRGSWTQPSLPMKKGSRLGCRQGWFCGRHVVLCWCGRSNERLGIDLPRHRSMPPAVARDAPCGLCSGEQNASGVDLLE